MYDGKVVFKVDLDTKDFTPQLEKTKKNLDGLVKNYEGWANRPGDATNVQKKHLQELSVQIQNTTNKYIDLKKKQDEVYQASYKKSLASIKNIGMMDNSMYGKSYSLQMSGLSGTMTKIKGDLPYVADGIKDISANVKDAGNNSIEAGKQAQTSGHLFDKGFKNGLNSAKKLALGIIGIRSAYMLARKAASAYMAEDTELTEKMNQAWVNLGAFLEPFLSWVADAMLKLTGYLNEFVMALTGTDYLARANAKAIQKQTQAQAGLNSEMQKYQQYDFDVIRTQSNTGSGTGGGGTSTSGLGDLGDVELNQNLVKGIRDFANAIKDLYNLLTYKDVTEAFDEWGDAERIAANQAEILNKTIGDTVDMITKNPLGKTDKEMQKSVEDYQTITKVGLIDLENILFGSAKSKIEAQEWLDSGNLKKWYGNLVDLLNKYVLGNGTPIMDNANDVLIQSNKEIKSTAASMQKLIYGTIQLGKEGKLTTDGYELLTYVMNNYGKEIDLINLASDEYKFTIDDVKYALGVYAKEYPTLVAQMAGFRNESSLVTKQVGIVTGQFLRGEISAAEYAKRLAEIPSKIDTYVKLENIEKAGKQVGTYVFDALNRIPTIKETKIEVDDKEAINETNLVKNNLLQLPSTIITTIKATLDTTEADRKANDFISRINAAGIGATVMQTVRKIMGFASGGYISQPTLAMVGEGKYNEYVIPEGEDYISRLASEIGKYGGGGGTTNVYLDGRLIQRQVNKTANQVSFTRNGR